MKRGHSFQGLWISFEAGEGAGKGTQIKLLEDYLKEKGYMVSTGREPGQTPEGEAIRNILQNPDMPELNPRTEMLLYIAAGITFFEKAVKPVLEKGGIFIADRWRDSTKAYQGHGLGEPLEVIDILTKYSCNGAYPDLTFLLDVPANVGLSHITGNEFGAHAKDKIESRPLSYHEKVNEGFRQIARENPHRIKIIPYIEGKIEVMHHQIIEEVNKYIVQHHLYDKLLKQEKLIF